MNPPGKGYLIVGLRPMVLITCLLHKRESQTTITVNQPHSFNVFIIPYLASQPISLKFWNSNYCSISIFGSDELEVKDVDNIKLLILCITDFIKKQPLNNKKELDISCLEGFRQTAFSPVLAIYKSSWNTLIVNKDNKTFHQKIVEQFIKNISSSRESKK